MRGPLPIVWWAGLGIITMIQLLAVFVGADLPVAPESAAVAKIELPVAPESAAVAKVDTPQSPSSPHPRPNNPPESKAAASPVEEPPPPKRQLPEEIKPLSKQHGDLLILVVQTAYLCCRSQIWDDVLKELQLEFGTRLYAGKIHLLHTRGRVAFSESLEQLRSRPHDFPSEAWAEALEASFQEIHRMRSAAIAPEQLRVYIIWASDIAPQTVMNPPIPPDGVNICLMRAGHPDDSGELKRIFVAPRHRIINFKNEVSPALVRNSLKHDLER